MGFMPMFGPGFGVGLMLCDGYAPVLHPPMAMDMPMDAGMDMSMAAPGQSAEPQHGLTRRSIRSRIASATEPQRLSLWRQSGVCRRASPGCVSLALRPAAATGAAGAAINRLPERCPRAISARSPDSLLSESFSPHARCHPSMALSVVRLASWGEFSWVHVCSHRSARWRSAHLFLFKPPFLAAFTSSCGTLRISRSPAPWSRSSRLLPPGRDPPPPIRAVRRCSQQFRSAITHSASASQALRWTRGPITIVSGSAITARVRLGAGPTLQPVTVSALAEASTETATPTTLVNQEDIERTPGANRSNSLAMITDFVPGTYFVHDQLHVRGGHQTTWEVDGVEIPNTNIADNLGPQIDPKDIETLETERGSYEADQGDRTYGVFNVVPKTGVGRRKRR